MAEYSKAKKRSNKSKSFRYIPITVLLFLAALILGLCCLFRITDVVITGNNLYTEAEVIEAAGIEKGDNLVFFSPSKTGARIVGKLAYADDVHVIVNYPSTVEIQLSESVAIAYIESGGSCWIIDADGKVLEQTDKNGASEVIAVSGLEITDPAVGQKIVADNDTKLGYLTELLRAMQNRNIQDKVSELNINSIANITFDYDGRLTVNYGDGATGTGKLDKIIEVIGRIGANAEGTLEFSGDGNVHFIPA